MNSFSIGWEGTGMSNNGAVMAVPIPAIMNLVGIQICCSWMPNAPVPSGVSNVLFFGLHVPNAQWGTWPIPGDTHAFIQLLNLASSVGQTGFGGVGAATVFGGAGLPGMLFAKILKQTLAPNAPGGVNLDLYVPLKGFQIAANDGLFFHMDHSGVGSVDAEMQGAVFYE